MPKIAPVAAILGVIGGVILGMFMGYLRGWFDTIASRIVEAFLSLPVVLIALLTVIMLGSSTFVVILVVAILFTPIVARTVRSAVLAERELDYVAAARLRGESTPFIMVREIFPNILPSDHRGDDRPVRLCDLHGGDPVVPGGGDATAVARLGPQHQ